MNIELTDISAVMEKAKLMSISSVAEGGQPQAAIVAYAHTPQFEVVFNTRNTSRKYANIARDGHVALVMGWDDNITVQYEGIASLLSPAEADQYKQIYFHKYAWAKHLEADPTIVFFKVTPKWLRYTDISQRPWVIREFNV